MRGRGWLDQSWRAALEALCHPYLLINSATATADRISAPFYAASSAAPDRLTAIAPAEDGYRLSFPWTTKEIALEDCIALDVDSAPFPDIPTLELTPAGLMALAAAADAVRLVLLTSIMQRQVVADFLLPVDHLTVMYRLSVEDTQADGRWLVTLLRLLAPHSFQIGDGGSASRLTSGYRELAGLGLLRDEGNGKWSPSANLMRLSGHWMTPVPAIAHEVVTFEDRQETTTHRLTLRGSGPLCVIAFEEAPMPKARLRSLEPGAYWLELFGMLSPPVPEEAAAAGATPATTSQCPACGTMVREGQKFCSECGASLDRALPATAASPPTCASCGAPLEPGLRFCTQCGNPITRSR
ncbi:zinc ribbon domain-containing protein [Thiorhodococcus minor]|uniref:Zinc ribbon domain-containing protein n=2 Tax=Thiorhodococcus minor TaxID=57489 RepID=A0A6M0JUA1_9GAMM|nr:zinc ribbon domain-containing protein [Thiorhodococcus minor]